MIAKIIVDISNANVDKVFDYEADNTVTRGCRVLVPFGNRQIEGYCLDMAETTDVPKEKLKAVISVVDEGAIISDEMMRLMEFMTREYRLKHIDVLRLFLPTAMRTGKVKELVKSYCSISPEYEKADPNEFIRKGATAQREIFDYVLEAKEASLSEINNEFSASAARNLIERGILVKKNVQIRRRPYDKIIVKDNHVQLNEEQRVAVDEITKELPQNDDEKTGNCFLLFGVTGSGKTEVYLNAIEKVLERGQNAIMLVPEISLTPQTMRVFRSRFGDCVAVLHSGLSDGERFDEWKRVLLGDARVIVGARSAIFAPVKNIGLIVIDEEHDSSYVSDSNPRYNAIEVAEFRRKYNNAKLVLGSATPSMSSFYKAQNGEYNLLRLKSRINNRPMPQIEIVDMRAEVRAGNNSIFSKRFEDCLTECLDGGNQAIVFLNRRGYSSYVMCRQCGYVAKCEDCDVSLVYHKEDDLLKCHYCRRQYAPLTICPNCKSPHIKRGFVGTEQVEERLRAIYPKASVLRMDNDTTRTKDAHLKIISDFAAKKADILVGTQMVTKGHDFPNVTFVGIVDADMSLHFSDYRSVERTFQLITQVAGRAGRENKPGRVILQTYTPLHYAYRNAVAYDYESFYDKEINLLRATRFPPFSIILRILISSENEKAALDTTKAVFDGIKSLAAKDSECFVYLNAMRAPIKRVMSKYRMQILMRILPERREVLQAVYKICNETPQKEVLLFTEINPSDLS